MASADESLRLSKTLSYWLRHQPGAGSLVLDQQGWAGVDAVLAALDRIGVDRAAEQLRAVVAANDKQRFELSRDGRRIRARQGHSVPVQLDWPVRVPPDLLYHGTAARALPAILDQGLHSMRRHHVHLSRDVESASRVGARHGTPVVLAVRAAQLHACGRRFYLTANGIWLTDTVPPGYLELV